MDRDFDGKARRSLFIAFWFFQLLKAQNSAKNTLCFQETFFCNGQLSIQTLMEKTHRVVNENMSLLTENDDRRYQPLMFSGAHCLDTKKELQTFLIIFLPRKENC